MGRFGRSVSLFKSSWAVIRADKELLLLPVISGVVSLVVMASFAFPAWFTLDHGHTVDAATGQLKDSVTPTPITYVLLVAFYVVSAFVVIFFNSALVCGANERFEGGDPTLGSALAGARSRIGLIFQWALVSATVSMIIRQIENRGLLGRIVGGLIGFAWAVVTYLVLPMLVLEGVGVGEALRRSKEAVRTTWGENIIGQGGMSLIGMLASIPGIVVGLLGVFAYQTSSILGVELIATGVLLLLGVVVVMGAMGVVYQTALYRYATQRPVTGFDPAALSGAFGPRRSRGGLGGGFGGFNSGGFTGQGY